MRGENGAAVKKSGTKKTIEDVRTVNKKINSKSLDNDKVSKSTRKKVKCELTPENINLFHEGKHYEAYGFMGAHHVSEKRKKGVRFTTWAPRAKKVYVVGDFSDFEIKDEEISGSDEVELPEASVFLETAEEEELQETEETEETPAVLEEKDDSVNPDVTETPDFLDQEESTVLPGCKMWINPEQEQIKAGKELLYTVKIENTGNCTLYNIHLGASFSEKSLKGIWEKAEGAVVQEETLKLDFLETGMQKEVYLSVQIPEAQSGKLSLNIEGKAEYEQNGEKQILSVEESRETEILPLKADFRVTKTADKTRAVPGDEIVFQICIQNTGERTLHSVVTTEKFRLKNVPVKFLEGEGLTLNKDRTKARIEKITPGIFRGTSGNSDSSGGYR